MNNEIKSIEISNRHPEAEQFAAYLTSQGYNVTIVRDGTDSLYVETVSELSSEDHNKLERSLWADYCRS